MRAALLLVLIALLIGCDGLLRAPTALDPQSDLLQIHSILWAGSDTLKVLVEEVDMKEGAVIPRPLSGARVRIAGGADSAELREAPAGFGSCTITVARDRLGRHEPTPGPIGLGCYAGILPGGIRAGLTYTLSVELADGRSVAGRTTVPPIPELVRPAEGDRLRLRRLYGGNDGVSDSVVLAVRGRQEGTSLFSATRAEAVYGAGRLLPSVRCTVHLLTGETGPVLGWLPAGTWQDSSVARMRLSGCRDPGAAASAQYPRADSVEAFLIVAAFDSSSASYLRDDRRGFGAVIGPVREERASAGLSGAYGFFGSAAATRRRLMLVLESP